MAARLRPKHQDEIRTKIQTTQLINVVQDHALGKEGKEISESRRKAAEMLLRKTLPDLSTVTLEGGETPLHIEHTKRPKLTPEQWLEAHGINK